MNSNYLWSIVSTFICFARLMSGDRHILVLSKIEANCLTLESVSFNVNELFLTMTKHLGLCYTCAEAASTASSPSDYSPPNLSPLDDSSFVNLSDEIVRELQQSIMKIDLDKINQIIARITKSDRLLAEIVNRHVNNFEYEQILNSPTVRAGCGI